MPTCLKDYLLLLGAGLCVCTCVSAASIPGENYRLLSRSTVGPLQVPLDGSERQWIQNKRQLILGTTVPDYPPFDLTVSGHDYEGFTADYAGILSDATGLAIKVKRFTSRDTAINALKNGDIDLLGSANGYEAHDPDLVLSRPYAVDQPVLVTREDETRSLADGLAGLRLSTMYHYLPPDEIKALYPKAIISTYPSYQNAINAVAFGQADVFLGDTISTHYMINKGYLNNIRMANFSRHEAYGFGFAVKRGNPVLLNVVNAVLAAVPASERENIAKRWSAGSDVLLTDQKLQLTEREERWLAGHPVVRVVVNEAFAPLTFFDAEGNLRGITADLLELIRLRTGLRFEIQRSRSDNEMIEQVKNHRADIIAALLPSGEREAQLNFSRPYLENSFVLLSRRSADGPVTLDQLDHQRLALAQGNPLLDYIRQTHPDIQLIETRDTFSAAELLANGKADGAVSSLVIANYFITSQVFQDKLSISSTIGTRQATFSMATDRSATELNSILDKALLSIAPDELGVINSRWRGYSATPQSTWHNFRRLFYQVVISAGLLLALMLAWNTYMRHQIKQRRRAERALNDQFEFMRSLVNGTPHPLYVRDREGRLQTCNDSYLQAFNVRREDIIGKREMPGTLGNEVEAREYQADYRRVVAEGTPLILDRSLQIGDQRLTVYHWILPYRDSRGTVQGIIGGWIDISERRQLFEELRNAKDRADEANRAKSTFLATMSHEIRTPMNAIIGMLELTLKRMDPEQPDRPAIEVAYQSANDLLGLIGDILDIARIESGRLSLSPERSHPRALVESVIRVFEGLARQKNLKLLLDFSPDHGMPEVLLDPLRFKQVLSNLISNAIKFTEHGEVRIQVSVQPTGDADQVALQVRVQDTGIGISEADQLRLFHPFAQADNSGQSARSGAGLGLVICRTLCEMMGGHLQMRSQPGVGTQVQLQLPLPALAPQLLPARLEAPVEPVAAEPLNVLVVDDHPANRLLMCQQLGYFGHRHHASDNGESAFQAWQQGCFDLVIADCNMPVMDGYELTRAIRQHERQLHLTPCTILGFTANAQPEEVQRCRQAGMDDCLFKPISLAALNQWMQALEQSSSQRIFNLDALSQLTGGNPQQVERLLSELLNSCRADREELRGLTNDIPQGCRDLAHKIKGAARIVQASRLLKRCEALERACHDESDLDEIARCRSDLDAAITELEQALLGQIEQKE